MTFSEVLRTSAGITKIRLYIGESVSPAALAGVMKGKDWEINIGYGHRKVFQILATGMGCITVLLCEE